MKELRMLEIYLNGLQTGVLEVFLVKGDLREDAVCTEKMGEFSIYFH